MDKLLAEVERVRGAIDGGEWNARRQRSVLTGTRERLERRSNLRRWSLVTAAMAIVVVGATAAWMRTATHLVHIAPPNAPVAMTPPVIAPEHELHLRDGSVAHLLGASSSLQVETDEPTGTRVNLLGGGARFDVIHNEARAFHVQADSVGVDVLGTVFVVEYVEPRGIRVTVDRGHVRIEHPSGISELGATESAVFSRAGAEEPASTPSRVTGVDDTATPLSASPESPATRGTWRALAGSGKFAEAYEAYKRQGGRSTLTDEPQTLLLAADVARLSGHPLEAVSPLRRLVMRYRSDERAAAAAFTLGKLYLDDLHLPQQAARAFAEASTLDVRGSLTEDALAREIEGWAKGGESKRARERARAFEVRFPSSPRLRGVRSLAGLE